MIPILAIENFHPASPQLYDVSLNATGIIVMMLVGVGMSIWISVAYLRHRKLKHLEQMPDVLGDPDDLLEQTCDVLGLGISERRILKKVAYRMKLPQPVSILLSPAMMIDAAKVWEKTHHFTPSQYWGLHRLDEIARKVFGKDIQELDQPEHLNKKTSATNL
jgi:hypothetical protein